MWRVDALFRATRSLECNSIQINKTDSVYPQGLALSLSDPSAILKMQQFQVVSRPNLPPKLVFCLHSLISFWWWNRGFLQVNIEPSPIREFLAWIGKELLVPYWASRNGTNILYTSNLYKYINPWLFLTRYMEKLVLAFLIRLMVNVTPFSKWTYFCFKVVVRVCCGAYFVAHVLKYLVPSFVSGRPAWFRCIMMLLRISA